MKSLVGGILITTALSMVACDGGKSSKSDSKPENDKTNSQTKSSVNDEAIKELQVQLNAFMTMMKDNQAEYQAKLLESIEKKFSQSLEFLNDLPKSSPEAVDTVREGLARIMQAVESLHRGDNQGNEKINDLIARLKEFETNFQIKQTAFHRACIASLNVADADDEEKRSVLNAIAFINTSKFARASEITSSDFDHGSRLGYGSTLPGVVFSGTQSEHRRSDNSYTYYAYSRLPSKANYRDLSYFSFEVDAANTITGVNSTPYNKFLINDQDNSYKTASLFAILDEQNPLKAIDANKIESYSRVDCDRMATYMANVGSKTLTDAIDNVSYMASMNTSSNPYVESIRNALNGENLVSDIIAWLDFRNQKAQDLRHATEGYSDSPRIMVLQDSLLRKRNDGKIDYSFLNLIDAPHLRFLAALDSEIGKAKVESGVDFDNDYVGKNESLISFITRHRHNPEVVRSEKSFRDLEAVFIDFVPVVMEKAPEEVKKKAHNLFHTP